MDRRLVNRGAGSVSYPFEQRRETRARFARQEKMEQRDIIGTGPLQRPECFQLVMKERETLLGIAQRLVASIAHELVILDQPMVRVLREGERRKLERVDDGQCQELEVGKHLPQERKIVTPEVVAEDEARPLGKGIELGRQGRCSALNDQPIAAIGPECRQFVDNRLAESII